MPVIRSIVTGGAGFLGSHLCDRLLKDGHDVVAVDNFSSGRRSNIEHLVGHARFRLIEHDITTPLNQEADRIYNLACVASPPAYQRDPIATTLTSVLGTYNCLELAHKTGGRLLQASTSEVYGDPQVHPQPESYTGNVNPVGPRACYDEGKRCAESLVMDFRRTRATSVRIARIFNTYGPRMAPDDGRVVSNFLMQALTSQPLTVFGDGSQTRSFCFVQDLVDGLVLVMESTDEDLGPVNLGNPHEVTVRELAELAVAAVPGSRSTTSFRPLPVDDPVRRCPDISRARGLGFEPRTVLREGLRLTAEHFRRTADVPG